MSEVKRTYPTRFESKSNKFEIWDNPEIWNINHREHYSNWLIKKLESLKSVIVEFVEDDYSEKVAHKYDLEHAFLRNLAHAISKTSKFTDAVFVANGYKGKLGLEIAITKLKILNNKINNNDNTLLTSKQVDDHLSGLRHPIKEGYWENLGVKRGSWNDFMILSFGKAKNEKRVMYVGKEGLNLAVKEVREMEIEGVKITALSVKNKHGGIPIAIDLGFWKEYEIRRGSWNDFMRLAIGKTNTNDMGSYGGKNGLAMAIKDLVEIDSLLTRQNKRTTALNVMKINSRIHYAIANGLWVEFGIRKGRWNDLFRLALNRTNTNDRALYHNKDGLTRAIKHVQKLDKKLQKKGIMLKSSHVSKNHSGIKTAISNGLWVDFGIRKGSWNDFMLMALGRINRKGKGYYIGKQGLERAVAEIKDSDKELRKEGKQINSVYLEKKLPGIRTAIKLGYWSEFGIKKGSWIEFKKFVFNQV